jgi:short-subunit dehydrogenase
MMKKICLILGGTSEIGQAIGDQFAKSGFDLYLTARHTSLFDQKLVEMWKGNYGSETTWFEFEALTFAQHLPFYEQLPQSPAVVVSAIGYLGDHQKAEQDFVEAKKIFGVNYLANVSILNIVAADMEKRKEGTIIGISSVAGDRGRKSNYFYGSAKAAFSSYLSGLRNRLYPFGVFVITVKPGFVRTKMTAGSSLPALLVGSKEEVAASVWKAFRQNKQVIYVPKKWKCIMYIIRTIPERFFRRMNI